MDNAKNNINNKDINNKINSNSAGEKTSGRKIQKQHAVTALILAGGRSSRFGSDKALMKYDNKGVVSRLAEECGRVCDEVLVITDTGKKFSLANVCGNVREIADKYRGMGPLGGLQAGLAAAKNSLCLLMACDMPLLTSEVMECFIINAVLRKCDIAMAKFGDDVEPVFGVYSKGLLPLIEKNLSEGRRSLLSLTKSADTVFFAEDVWQEAADGSDVFFNVNFQSDYEKLLNGENDHASQKQRKKFYKEFLDTDVF